MRLALTLIPLVLAGPVESYSRRAEVLLPESGPAVLDLSEVQLYPYRDDLLLLDATGQAVPYTLLGSWEREVGGEQVLELLPVGTPPARDQARLDTRTLGRAITRIHLDVGPPRGLLGALFGSGHWAAEVAVQDGAGREVARELLWRARVGGAVRQDTTLDVPALPPGVYTLVAEFPLTWTRATVEWVSSVLVPTLEVPVAVGPPLALGAGVSAYEVLLPSAGLEVEHMDLEVADPRFARDLEVYTQVWSGGAELGEQRVGAEWIERLELGGSAVSHLRVELGDMPLSDRLSLRVEDGRDAPLDIRAARLTLRNRRILIEEPGANPHTLYAAPGVPDERTHDLGHASAELLRADPPLVRPTVWGPNPEWNPTAALPPALWRGAQADLSRYTLSRPLTGPGKGQAVRWVLPVEGMGQPGRSPAECRVVDAEGYQVPFLVEDRGLRPVEVQLTRAEEGALTRLTLTLPVPTELAHLRVNTASRVFERRVSISQRAVETWTHGPEDADPVLFVDLDTAATERLELLVHNGDDQPLAGLEVQAFGPVRALVAVDPGPGARLVCGGPYQPPDYDLVLVSQVVLRGVVAEGEVGPEERIRRSSDLDRRVGLGLVAALAAGLLVLAFRLVREPDPPAA